jgi:hypothetical protein
LNGKRVSERENIRMVHRKRRAYPRYPELG